METFISDFFPFFFIKLMILGVLLIYIVFAAIIVRQEELMSRVVEVPSSPLLKLLVTVHFVATLAAFVLALILL